MSIEQQIEDSANRSRIQTVSPSHRDWNKRSAARLDVHCSVNTSVLRLVVRLDVRVFVSRFVAGFCALVPRFAFTRYSPLAGVKCIFHSHDLQRITYSEQRTTDREEQIGWGDCRSETTIAPTSTRNIRSRSPSHSFAGGERANKTTACSHRVHHHYHYQQEQQSRDYRHCP